MSRSRLLESRMLGNPQVRFGGGQTKKEQQCHLVGWLPTFDNINHEALLRKLNTYPAVRRVIKAWLKAGAVDNGVFEQTISGTPQGGLCKALHKPPYAKQVTMQRDVRKTVIFGHFQLNSFA